ncbi:dynamin family protein [Crocosphaera sp. XPORK-15E]|uniref:dynamin family protein n=1 Tax=Crocosphaera sp. XPORK-15E TaxID=3110247 RepID=UPI002B1FCA65|nr:dynamin family protein [Crocosphaera sp. XPORK-15E]MEA5533072.1 dynamin family protein [Crocosphaera sp. XPORK-15E]
MTTHTETTILLQDLERVSQVRSKISSHLIQIADTLEKGESLGKNLSGKLELDRDIEDLSKVSKNLRECVFRLLVLGDMKRGKSTFLNALIGENLLPSDVNPCTALLTIVRYGKEKQVTVYFNDGTSPQKIDYKTFKERYTIDPSEAKQLEREKKQAFPTVDYAVVEYPLPLLEKGIEIVDSPGLNDTEARNELSLGYINNCHAILFVMRASQPCTLGERRYLENYIKDRGLSIFFLINAWDQVKESLIDPDDPDELAEAEGKLRKVFHANLAEYCQIDGYNLYDERVFEISALTALRQRLKNPDAPLKDTGFSAFLMALNTFLTKERAIAEFRQALTLARQASSHVREAVERRIPLLQKDVEELKIQINSVEPEFKILNQIQEQFKGEIREIRDEKARIIADSFRDYVLNLGNTFESDFIHYQPNLNFLDFLSSGKREAFEQELRQAFEKYISDRIADWSKTAEKEMDSAFLKLSKIATSYGDSYTKITDRITEKLTGTTLQNISGSSQDDHSPSWAKWAAGIFSLARGNIAGVAMAGAGFDWKNIILNFITVFGVGAIITSLTGIVLGPIGLALLGFGVGMLQADQGRKELVKVAKKELIKHLPKIAQEQSPKVYDAIKECFDGYEKQITERINDDINSRKAELDNLVKQKESHEINQGKEIERLTQLEQEVKSESQSIEMLYQNFLTTAS